MMAIDFLKEQLKEPNTYGPDSIIALLDLIEDAHLTLCSRWDGYGSVWEKS